ncbi:uncharacterized protein BJ212DRAFT_40808 [Suillus subaureus]|uniref:Uncharacterized protein n=1 Tax=Suillus subaureus TaxID=48587 RepID=A0A9P7JKA0_9AGAM|nr:uncharacterized protein BJ212DRAFT_40808 [Suillus subaureus]KAG1827248.1 hypothetical protein BJ212DRAFT_40808 [Suillus subaureus]
MQDIDNISFLGSHSTFLSLYHFLWQKQDQSVIKQGVKCYALDVEGFNGIHLLTFDAVNLSGCPDAKLPNGATSMVIRSEYELLFEHISAIERNFIVHESAGIGKSHFLAYILVKRLLARQPVTYQIDQLHSSVMCFTADGFFTLPQEGSEYHPLFQREDVWHLVDSTHEDPTTHPNTTHTQALMWGTRGKAIFTTFWLDSFGFKIDWSPGYEVSLQRWMKPCTWDEIVAMSALTANTHEQHNPEALRWSYTHFGSNAHACLQVSRHPSHADYYLHKLECARDNFWFQHPVLREHEALYSRNLFAVQPGDTRTEPLPYPVSQVASRLLADGIASLDPSIAKDAVCSLLNSEDAEESGKIFYRQAVIALMSRFGGTFELGCLDSQGHCQPAHKDLNLCAKLDLAGKEEQAILPSSYTYSTQGELAALAENHPHVLHSPTHALVHPGIDAIMFDDSTSTVWLMQVTYGHSRPISPQGLLFLLNTARGTTYEPSPIRPWNLVFISREQATTDSFQLSGSKETEFFCSVFWDPRIKLYVMRLRDTGSSSSDPYEQWGFPYKTPRKYSISLSRRLTNRLLHLLHRPRRETGLDKADQVTARIQGTIIQASGVPGAQLLGEMTSEQPVGPNRFHMRIPTMSNAKED